MPARGAGQPALADADQAAAARARGLGHGRAWTPRSATSCAPATRRSSSAAASSASAGGTSARPTASSASSSTSSGARASTPRPSPRRSTKNPGVRAVYATASETSTATKHDVEAIAKVVRAKRRRHPVRRRHHRGRRLRRAGRRVGPRRHRGRLAEGADAAARAWRSSSSRTRRWKANERANLPRFYLDLARERKSQEKGETAFTPAVSLIVGPARVAAHAQGRDARGRLEPPRAAGQGDARRGGRPRPRAVLVVADERRHRLSACPSGIDGTAVIKQMRTALRHHHRGRAGSPEGEDRPHRPHRLLQRVRHHHRHLGPRDDAVRPRLRHSAGRRASRPRRRPSPRPGGPEGAHRQRTDKQRGASSHGRADSRPHRRRHVQEGGRNPAAARGSPSTSRRA